MFKECAFEINGLLLLMIIFYLSSALGVLALLQVYTTCLYFALWFHDIGFDKIYLLQVVYLLSDVSRSIYTCI